MDRVKVNVKACWRKSMKVHRAGTLSERKVTTHRSSPHRTGAADSGANQKMKVKGSVAECMTTRTRESERYEKQGVYTLQCVTGSVGTSMEVIVNAKSSLTNI